MDTKTLELSVKAVPANVARVRRRVGDLASAAGMPAEVVDDVRLCVSEAVANAVLHAYDRTGGIVEVGVAIDDDELTVVVRDAGAGIGPPARDGHGYGLRLIRELSPRSSILSASSLGTEVRMTFPRAAYRVEGSHGR